MRIFQNVVEAGGFSAAARKLDLPPAAVTRLVKDLEEHLGVRLLQRTTRHVSLTRAGEIYMARLRPILSDISEAEMRVRAESHEISGALRVLAPSMAASHMLAAATAGFQRLHPAVAVDIDVFESAQPPVHEYDVALLTGEARVDPDFICRPVMHSALVFCAAPDYLARWGEPAAPADLMHHRLLRLRQRNARSAAFEVIRPGEQELRLRLDVPAVIVSNDIYTLLRATLDGAGISSQPLDLVAPLVTAGRLQRVLGPWITGHLTLVAALASRKFMPARTRAFLDYLVAHSTAASGTLGPGPGLALDLQQGSVYH